MFLVSAPCPSLWWGLTLKMSAVETLYGGQFTLSTQLILPCYTPPLIQLHSFFRNVPHLWLINWLIDYLTDWPLIDWLIDCLNLYMFVINLIHHGKSVCMVHVFMHPLVWVRNLACSLHCLFQLLLLPTHV